MSRKCAVMLVAALILANGKVPAETRERDLKVHSLGINGFEFTYQNKTLLIDPYVSRAPKRVSVPQIVRKHISRADYVILTHSHWDHLADVPEIARYTDAVIAGSETTLNICRYFGISESRLRPYRAHEAIEFGNFTVTPIPSKHKVPLGYPGRYDAVPKKITGAADYVEGGTWALLVTVGGKTFLNVASANLIDKELQGIDCDYLLASIAGRADDYLPRLLRCVNADVFIPTHWDDFFGRPVEDSTERGSLDAFAMEMKRVAPSHQVHVLKGLETLPISSPGCDSPMPGN